jgi:hypothetical protein
MRKWRTVYDLRLHVVPVIMAKLKIARFDEHFFPIEIYFCANETEWHSLLKDCGFNDEPYPDERGARCTQFVHNTKLNVAILTISNEAEEHNSVEVMGMLVHELIHLKQFAEFSMYGNNAGRGEQRLDIETEAYLMQKLTMWMFSAFADSGRKFKDE